MKRGDPAVYARLFVVLHKILAKFPNRRVGQIIGNACDFAGHDSYYVEDETLCAVLEAYLEKMT